MHHLTIRVLSISDERLHRDGIDILVRYFLPKSPNPIFSVLRPASKPPTNRPQKQVLRPRGGRGTTTGPDATPPPSYLQKLAGRAVGAGMVGGRMGGGGGIGSSAGGGGGAARHPLLPHAYLKGVCVCGGMGV